MAEHYIFNEQHDLLQGLVDGLRQASRYASYLRKAASEDLEYSGTALHPEDLQLLQYLDGLSQDLRVQNATLQAYAGVRS